MLVPVKWLKDYVSFDEDIQTFSDMMTLTGTKVEGVELRDKGIKGVITAKVTEIKEHPDSDHMWVCKLDDGLNIRTIVTGAQNVRIGDIVPMAVDGAIVNGGQTIITSELRGMISEGMLCSAPELGIEASIAPKFATEGIYILPEDTPVGIDVKEVLALDGVVIDFELTNNRQDCNSMLGIAYEAAATTGTKFEYPDYEFERFGKEINDYLSIEVENRELCRRYTARMVKITKVEPSPMWMQVRLMGAGVRPINNIVDVSNFVMLETGQPLHTFDYNKLADKKIIVKNAKDGETITTLDGIERELTSETLMIDDGNGHVAVAGVMGGGNSDIDDNTNLVVIESANFDKNTVRKTSKHFGLRTESSSRFEKGISIHLTKYAADRAASLLVELGAAEYIDGIIDIYDHLDETVCAEIDVDWLNRFSGISFAVKEVLDALDLLGFEPKADGHTIHVSVPRFRQDIAIKEDLAEEVIRIYGYDKIPSTLMETSNFTSEPNRNYIQKQDLKDKMIGIGGHEILTYSFVSPTKLESLKFEQDDVRRKPAVVINPLGEDNSVMRTTLITGLLDALSLNYNRKNKPELMFEMGGIYLESLQTEKGLPGQFEKLCFGKFHADYFDAKSVVEYLIQSLKIENVTYQRSKEPMLHPGRSADLLIQDKLLGYIGQVHPTVAKAYEVCEDTVIAELDVALLLESAKDVCMKSNQTTKYPGVERDLALVCEDSVLAGELIDAIYRYGGTYLVSCDVFDVYKNDDVLGEGKKSIAFSLMFRSDTETLTDEQTEEMIQDILTGLEKDHNAILRS